MEILSFLYGLGLALLVYWVSYLSGKALMGKGSIPIVIILGKYFIYWKAIELGFTHLKAQGIIVGLVTGVYISLPVLYLINRKINPSQSS